MRPAYLEVNIDAVRGNVVSLQRLVGPGCAVAPVVKANAYGHGAVAVARAALEAGGKFLCVAIVGEGVELRDAGIDAPILVLGPPDAEEAEAYLDYDLMPTISDPGHCMLIAEAAGRAGKRAQVHVKLDTGMGRHGARPAVVEPLARLLCAKEDVELIGIFSHFADVYDADLRWSCEQIETFRKLTADFCGDGRVPLLHMAGTGGIVRLPESRFDAIRPGSILYGMRSGLAPEEVPEGIRPVASLKCRVGAVKLLEAGQPVGYRRTWRAPQDTRLAILPIGYADGYPRSLSNNAEVLLGGVRCPVVGAVSMDAITVDATAAPEVGTGDEAVLIGRQGDEQITFEEVAARAGSIVEEVSSRLGSRLERIYLGGSERQ